MFRGPDSGSAADIYEEIMSREDIDLNRNDYRALLEIVTRKIHSMGKDRKPEDDQELWNLSYKVAWAGAQAGDGECMHWLGEIFYGKKAEYVRDRGDTIGKAENWWTRAVLAGNGRSAVNLALLHLGKPIPGSGSFGTLEYNEELAYKLFVKGYELGDSKAGRHIGNCYRDGIGTEKDLTKAYEWYVKAAECGDSSAALFIADFKLDGIGTEQDIESAINRYEVLVECKGHDIANAAAALARIYRTDKYVPANIELSDRYYRIVIEYANEREAHLAAEARTALGVE